MHVLVIGGTGLISTGITRQLVADGHEVTVYNRGETEADIPESVSQLAGDRIDTEGFANDVADGDFGCVIDMICFDPDTARDAVETFAGEIEQYIFCSTVDVYDRPSERNPITEDAQRHDDEHFVSDYGLNKTLAEDVFREAHDRGDFAATIIRPWSTYGEGGTVLHTLGTDSYYVDRVREGKPIVVHGDGTSLWGPCHRDDVAGAFVNAVGNESAYGEAYHVTSEEVITWNQYHRRVAQALDAPEPDLVHIPTDVLAEVAPDRTGMLLDHFRYSTVFDNSKAKRDLDFEYTVSFEEGVRRTVDAMDERDGVDSWETEPFEDELIESWRESTATFVESFSPDA